MKLQTKHYIIIAGALIALGMQISGLEHGWRDAMTPGFIGGLVVQIGKDILNLLTDAPRDPERRTRADDRVSDSKVAELNQQNPGE